MQRTHKPIDYRAQNKVFPITLITPCNNLSTLSRRPRSRDINTHPHDLQRNSPKQNIRPPRRLLLAPQPRIAIAQGSFTVIPSLAFDTFDTLDIHKLGRQ